MEDTLTIILAGGVGSRLHPLTEERAKPAVPFGGKYRIIDFTLANCLHSGMRKVLVLTQYRAGLADFQNVLDTERTLLIRQDDLASSEGLVIRNLVDLYRALGGGWDPETARPPATPPSSLDGESGTTEE